VAKKANCKPTVYFTERALLDIAGIESHSIEQFGKRVADQYIGKLEAGLRRISEKPDLLREEIPFHNSLRFYRVEKHLLVCEVGVVGKIFILTLLHASMDIPSRLAELEPNLSLETELLVKRLRRSAK
jgi:toxin ParE1/3/4